MTIEKEVEEVVKPLNTMAGTAPHWVGIILIVCVFMAYLWRRDLHDEKMAEIGDHITTQRIEQCHEVQTKCAEAMDAMAVALHEQGQQFRDFTRELEQHRHEKWRNEQ